MTDWPQISIELEKEHEMCFACGQDNPIGLKLRFDWDGKTASITKRTRKLLETKALIFASDGAPVAEATAKQFIVKTGQEKEKTKAVIWDMDGVIADTASYHFKAWHEVFQKRGVDFTEQDFRRHFGQRNDTIIRNALGGEIAAEEMDTIATEKERAFRKAARQNVKPLPGVIALIKALGKHGFKLAIASCAPDENIQLLTRDLGIDSYFNAITSGREVSEGKPDPQCFLLAAGRLGIEPGNCIVIEDAIAGVTAARRAGMRCIAVTNTHPREKLKLP
jgi:beta-phosphoglucomutase family hydrolase